MNACLKKLAANDIHVFCLIAIYSTLYHLRRHEQRPIWLPVQRSSSLLYLRRKGKSLCFYKILHILITFQGFPPFAMSKKHFQPTLQGFFVRPISHNHSPVLISRLPKFPLQFIALRQPQPALPEQVFTLFPQSIHPCSTLPL